jgi:hypothetical protein
MSISELCAGRWRKSSHSAVDNDDCVDVAVVDDVVAVRDSKDSVGPILIFSSATWSTFVSALKYGMVSQPTGYEGT